MAIDLVNQGQATVGTSAADLPIERNTKRSFLLLKAPAANTGVIYVRFRTSATDTTAATTADLPLEAGASLGFGGGDGMPAGTISAIASAANQKLNYLEG